MRLGTETGSVINHLYSRGTIGQPKPVVGMGATILMWSDRAAATIVSVQKLRSWVRSWVIVGVQRDRSRVVSGSGMDGSAVYEFEPNPNGRVEHFRSVNGGAWHQVVFNAETKRWNKVDGHGLRIGQRDEYRDPSF